MIITCPSCRGQGHVEGYDCQCLGWGRLKVEVIGPCSADGEVQSMPLDEWARTHQSRVDQIMADWLRGEGR